MKLTKRQALAADLPWPGKTPRKPADANGGADGRRAYFLALCEAWGLPKPVPEYPFGQEIGRRWRFDYLLAGWLAVEVIGGVWTRGHHSRGRSQLDDMERRNAAQMLGFCVLEFSPQQVEDGSAFATIRKALNLETP